MGSIGRTSDARRLSRTAPDLRHVMPRRARSWRPLQKSYGDPATRQVCFPPCVGSRVISATRRTDVSAGRPASQEELRTEGLASVAFRQFYRWPAAIDHFCALEPAHRTGPAIRSWGLPHDVADRLMLERVSFDLLAPLLPTGKGVRLLGVSLSALGTEMSRAPQLSLLL